MGIKFRKFRKFWLISQKLFPRKYLESCKFAKFMKFYSHKNLKSLNRGNPSSQNFAIIYIYVCV